MPENPVWNLIAKKLSGEANWEELNQLERLLKLHPEIHYPLQTIQTLWSSELETNHDESYKAFERVENKLKSLDPGFGDPEKNHPGNGKRKSIGIITGLLALATVLIYFLLPVKTPVGYSLPKQNSKPFSEISTRNGSKTNLILPDGTKVWLNAGSKLVYDSSYGKKIREVSLSGEAYFDVVKNKQKPFVIHASNINIKVLGTAFNVKSYPTDQTTEAALIRGSIEVTFRNKPDKKVILKPNEKIVVRNEQSELAIMHSAGPARDIQKIEALPAVSIQNLTYEHKTGAIIETSWVEDRLVFQDESFGNIARQLERWYGVSIKFEHSDLRGTHLTGSFKNETVRQALDALKLTASFDYSVDAGNNIIIF